MVDQSEAGDAADAVGARDRDDAPARGPLGRKALIDRIVQRAGLKRTSDAVAAAEATLSVIAEVLADGQDLNAPPLGRLRVVRSKDNGKGRVLTLRLAMPRTDGRPEGDLAPDGSPG